MVPLNIVPTELTDRTEAYGFIFLESTERIDAARHTTDGTEMIACVAVGGELCLTSGDRKEPEDIDVYNKNLFLSLGKAEREEEEKEEDAVSLGFLSVTRG